MIYWFLMLACFMPHGIQCDEADSFTFTAEADRDVALQSYLEDARATQDIVFHTASVGASGYWATSKSSDVYILNEGKWEQVDGNLIQVDVGHNVVWGTSKDHHVYYRNGMSRENPEGTEWVMIGGRIKQVSVSQKGHVWAVSAAGGVFHLFRASNENHAGKGWHRVKGMLLDQVSVGCRGVWGLSKGNDVYFRTGTNGDPYSDAGGSGWEKVPGDDKMKFISSGNDVYAIDAKDKVYKRTGLTAEHPMGKKWKSIDKYMTYLDVMDIVLIGVEKDGWLYSEDIKSNENGIHCCIDHLNSLFVIPFPADE